MSETLKNIIILGAGGNLGPSILKALTDDSFFTVSILSRKSSKSTFPSHLKVHTVDDDYPEDQLLEAFKGQDAVVCTISGYQIPQEKSIINAAVKAGVKRYFPSEFGANLANPKTAEALYFFGAKLETVKHLKEQESKGLTWSGVVTGPFFDFCLKGGLLGFDIANHKATIFDGGNSKLSTTNLSTIGLSVAKSLHKPRDTANRYVYVASFTTTQNEILAAMEKATGKKWDVTHASTAEKIQEGKDLLSNGNMSGILVQLQGVLFLDGIGGDYAKEKGLDNDLLGLPAENFQETIDKVVQG